MQEVFEKIIEKLEKKSDELYKAYCIGFNSDDRAGYDAYVNAIEIVKRAAEECRNGHFGCDNNGEHEKCNGCGLTDCKNRNTIWFGVSDDNNGWIPCSERLPEEHDSVFAKFKGTAKWNDSMFQKISNEVNVTVSDEKGDTATTNAHTTDGTWKCDILSACTTYQVIAWQPLPEPYHPKGE